MRIICTDFPAADGDADKAAAAATADDVSQPPTSETAQDMSPESDQPQEASADTVSTEPMEGTDTDTATSSAGALTDDPAEDAFAGAAAMDTDTTSGAAASAKEQPSELPFQVQITYTDLDGAEAVRVLTQTQPVTRDRLQAETSMSHYFILTNFLFSLTTCLEKLKC